MGVDALQEVEVRKCREGVGLQGVLEGAEEGGNGVCGGLRGAGRRHFWGGGGGPVRERYLCCVWDNSGGSVVVVVGSEICKDIWFKRELIAPTIT